MRGLAAWDEAEAEVKVSLGLIFPDLTASAAKTVGFMHLA